MTHTLTDLEPYRQGVELQSTVPDDFGGLMDGPHELWGYINGIPVTIASVPSQKQTFGMDDLHDVEISEEEGIENLNRLAHCWNCYDGLIAALRRISALGDGDGEAQAIADEALKAAGTM